MEILETNLAVHPHCQDLLKDTVFGPPSTQTDSSSRLLLVPKFLPKDVRCVYFMVYKKREHLWKMSDCLLEPSESFEVPRFLKILNLELLV